MSIAKIYAFSPVSKSCLFLYLVKRNKNVERSIERLLLQTAKIYPNVTIRAAISEKHQLNLKHEKIIVDVIDINNTDAGGRQSTHNITEGWVWQHLINKVDTSYIFAALDLLLFIDSKDVNLIRMVRICILKKRLIQIFKTCFYAIRSICFYCIVIDHNKSIHMFAVRFKS